MTDAQFRALAIRVAILERKLGNFVGGGATVTPHATQHEDGGSDPVDIKDLPGYPGGTTTFLRGDATFAAPTGTDVAKIEEKTPSGTGTATFSSLGSFTHLMIAFSVRSTDAGTAVLLQMTVNGDTGSNYDIQLISAGATTITASESIAGTDGQIATVSAGGAPSGAVGIGTINIPDYRGTTFRKGATAFTRHQTTDASGGFAIRQRAWGWRSTSAITSITLALAAGNYVSGSKLTLYGFN